MMRRRCVVFIAIVALAAAGLAAQSRPPGIETATATPIMGMITRHFVDEERRNWEGTGPRPLRTAAWYPPEQIAARETIFGGPVEEQVFAPIVVSPGAELSKRAERYPLVVLSHGTGGSAVQMIWLGTYLASHGYIVAAVNHHGNTASEKRLAPEGFLLYWERPRDLRPGSRQTSLRVPGRVHVARKGCARDLPRR